MDLSQMLAWCASPTTHRAMEINYKGMLLHMAETIEKKPFEQIVKDYDDALDLVQTTSVMALQVWEAAILHMSAVKLAHDRKSAANLAASLKLLH